MPQSDAQLPRHDRYFRYAFSTPEAGRDLLSAVVPARLLGNFRVVSVEAGGLDSVDERLTEQRLDLVVTVVGEDNTTILVYFLFEHKSRPEPHVLFQLFGYTAAVWKHCIAVDTVDQNGKVPGIIPVVVYHGNRRWSAPTDLRGAVQSLPNAGALEQRFSYVLYDLHRIRADSIGGGARTRSALLTLKYAAERLSRGKMRVLFDTLNRLSSDETAFRRTTLRYLLEERSKEEQRLIFTGLEEGGYTEIREDAMTIAEALRSEGWAKGRTEGLSVGRAEGLSAALIDQFVARFGGIDDRQQELIATVSDEALLRAALREIVRSEATPESVIDKLR